MKYAGSRDAMLDQTESMLREAVGESAQIVCLQELFASPYPCQAEDHTHFDFAEPIDGVTVTRMRKLAADLQTVIVIPIFERRAPGVYHNTVVVAEADGSIAGVYRKMHIPDDPLFYEKFYFTPGDQGFPVIETRFAKLGVGICWDQWFPEAARMFALGGAEILFYPTAIGWITGEKEEFGAGQLDAWQTSMRAHAIANGVWLGAPNRVGLEGEIEFWGASFVASPRGEFIGQAGHGEEHVLCVDCNLDEIDVVRTHWPFLRDRRIDAYDNLSKRWID
jgi:N-carbamoylputrescine amidase